MGKVTAFTAQRSKEIEDRVIVNGLVDANGRLILTRNNGESVDAGSVKGGKGDPGATGQGVTFLAGLIFAYGGGTPPTGYLICNGAAVSRTTYPTLFAAIGTNYGAGDGVTTFNLPDFRGRQVMGLDASQTEFATLAKTGGHKTMQRHYHMLTPEANGVAYVYAWGGNGEGNVNIQNAIAQGGGTSGNRLYTQQNSWNRTSDSGRPAGSEQDNNLDPYAVANYIISIGNVVSAPGGDPIKTEYLLRGTSAERDALFGIPGTNAASIALAQKRVVWYNVEKGWEEMYYEVNGLAGLGVPGIGGGRPRGWYPHNAGSYRILPKRVDAGTADAQGLIVPTGQNGDIWVDCFSNDFVHYRISGRLTTDSGSLLGLGFIRTDDGSLYSTKDQYWQAATWAQGGAGNQYFAGANDPTGWGAVGISGTAQVLGHSFDLLIESPFLSAHSHVTGTFGFHGGAVGGGSVHGGVEQNISFKGIRLALNSTQKFVVASSEFTVYGIV